MQNAMLLLKNEKTKKSFIFPIFLLPTCLFGLIQIRANILL